MKTLITYQSRTGNTAKIAQAIHDALGANATLQPMDQVNSLEGYDLTFVGFPIEKLGPSERAGAFLADKAAGHKIALFVTHGAPEVWPMVTEWLAKCRAAAAGSQLVAMFNCQGELGEVIANAMAQSGNPMLAQFAAGRSMTLGQPNAERVERARAFARETVAKATS